MQDKIDKLYAESSETQQAFKRALKKEYFLKNEDGVTKQSFLKWIKQKTKGLSLLREFEKHFDRLSTQEQQSLEGEKVKLFVEAIDAALQNSLVKI